MRRIRYYRHRVGAFIVICGVSWLMVTESHAAKYAGDAFSIGVGARQLALGGAAIAGPFDGSAAYWNPAGLAFLERRNIFAMHAETFGSLLNHDFVAYSSSLDSGLSAVQAYGFYFYYLGGGGIKITKLDPISGRPYVEREESHGDYLLGSSLAGVWGEVRLGATARVFYRDLGVATGWGGALDVGGVWQWRPEIRLGLTVTDLSTGYIHYSNGTTESVIPAIKPGLMYERPWRDWTFRGLASGDIRFEGRKSSAQYYQGSVSLDTHYGAEISFRERIFARIGADIGKLTAGGGVALKSFAFDVAYLHHSDLDNTYRLSAGYTF